MSLDPMLEMPIGKYYVVCPLSLPSPEREVLVDCYG